MLNDRYKIKIEPDARLDIQEAINWYNSQQKYNRKIKLYTKIKSKCAENTHFKMLL
jgi:hypothetical protein